MHIHKRSKEDALFLSLLIEQTIQIALQKTQNTYCPHFARNWPKHDIKIVEHVPFISHERCCTLMIYLMILTQWATLQNIYKCDKRNQIPKIKYWQFDYITL